MLFNKVFYVTLTVCILSLFLYQPVSAHMSGESVAGNKWDAEYKELKNNWNDVDRSVNEYHAIRGQVETLISGYDATKSAVESGTEVTIVRGGAAIIATGVAFASGGSLAPAVWLFIYATKSGIKTLSLNPDKYLSAMGTAVSAMNRARTNVFVAYDGGGVIYVRVNGVDTTQGTIGYAAQYKRYLKMAAGHLTVNQSWLDTKVNMENVTRPYYHDHHNSSGSGLEHVITKRTDLSHWQVKPLLERKYLCKGKRCGRKFGTPWKAFEYHRRVCEITRRFSYKHTYSYKPCKHVYYSCRTTTCPRANLHMERPTEPVDLPPIPPPTPPTQTPPSPPPPPPAMHACGVHAITVLGTHSAAGCGVSGHYACDGSDHSLQASCTQTNASGQSCTVSSFYACQSHTHVYPAPPQLVTCARSECHDSVTTRYEHRSTCPNCSSINLWSCDAVGVKWHTQVKTCKRTKNGVSCGQSFTSCSNTNTCFYGWKHTGTAHHVN